VALRPGGDTFSIANNQRGIATLIKRLKKLQVSLVVLEASGGYEVAATDELVAAELPLAVLNLRKLGFDLSDGVRRPRNSFAEKPHFWQPRHKCFPAWPDGAVKP
jgi:hypothetical protein